MSDYHDEDPGPGGEERLPALRQQSAMATAEQRKVVSEIQARVAFARHNPRDWRTAMDAIERDCQRPRLAEQAIYHYPRGGTDISGPSIRLMETIARRWGNIADGVREVYRDTDAGFSECVAFAWDMESNYYSEREFVVKHWRDTRGGGYRLTDERDIYEMIANYGQRRKRACLIAVIPGDVIEVAEEWANRTLEASVDMKPETITRLVAAFAEYGVTAKQIETRIQRKMEAIYPAQVVQLRKIYASLKDGVGTVKDFFPDETTKAWTEIQHRQAANVVPMPTKETVKKEAVKKEPPGKKAAAKKMQAAPPPAPEFEAYLLDANGEPVNDDPFTDTVLYVEALQKLVEAPGANRIGLLEQNADGIADAMASASGELAEIIERMTAPPAETAQTADDATEAAGSTAASDDAPIPVIEVKTEGGKRNNGQYVRDFGTALAEHVPERFLDFLAAQKPTIDTLPASARLLVLKAIAAQAEHFELSVPEEFRQAPKAAPASTESTPPPAPKPDKDAGFCQAHIDEMDRAQTREHLQRFTQTTVVSTHYARWQRERPELAQRMQEAMLRNEQRFTS